jgi:LPS O-antigen subunit length determinant protein (WzzB/FepE family)
MEQDKTGQNQSFLEDTINLKELFSLLWGGKKLIILVAAVFALCSVLYAMSLTNYYRSDSVLALTDRTSGVSSLSRFGGIASLAGITLPTGATDKGSIIVNTILSRAFLKNLLSFEDVLPSIMATESYNSETKQLVFDSDVYDTANKKWLQAKPSYIQTYDVYMSQMAINYDMNVGLIYISMEHKSPIFAKEFLDLVIREADASIRQTDLEHSSDALEYLVSEISKTPLIAMKTSMNQLIHSQLETQMMAKISTNYSLKAIEPPFIPEKKFKPSRSLISLLGTMLGFVLGVCWILIRHYYALNTIKQT